MHTMSSREVQKCLYISSSMQSQSKDMPYHDTGICRKIFMYNPIQVQCVSDSENIAICNFTKNISKYTDEEMCTKET